MTLENVSVYLKNYPDGMIKESDMEVVRAPVRELKEDEVLLRVKYFSIDPYMRGRMRPNVKSYVESFTTGHVLEGTSVSVVEKIGSKVTGVNIGEKYVAYCGWEKYTIVNQECFKHDGKNTIGMEFTRIPEDRPVPDTFNLGVTGMPGMTAWALFTKIGMPKEGETVFVTAAAGAVGQVVCQLAKVKGLRVVATASSPEKVGFLKNFIGVDEAFSYKDYPDKESMIEQLKKVCPDGIDIYFDNVGGYILDAVLTQMNVHGRCVECGMISQYNLKDTYKYTLQNIIQRRITIQAGLFGDFFPRCFEEFIREVAPLLEQGKIKYKEDVVEGVENAPKTFVGMFNSQNFGKIIIKPWRDFLKIAQKI